MMMMTNLHYDANRFELNSNSCNGCIDTFCGTPQPFAKHVAAVRQTTPGHSLQAVLHAK
jgi:hypothetical protein